MGQPCTFALPAPATDAAPWYTLHRAVLSDSLRKLGYSPVLVEEGWAVALASLGARAFSGLTFYCGADQVSVCLTYRGVARLDFSLTPGESWVEEQAASALELSGAEIRRLRQAAPSVLVPRNRHEQAIAVAFRSFLEEVLKKTALHLSLQGAAVAVEPLEVVWAGSGTTPADLGEALLRQAKRGDFTLPLEGVSCPTDPALVARGCLASTMLLPDEGNKP